MANLAVFIPAPKAPLEIHEAEIYNPGAGEILIRNEVIGLNQVESKIAKSGNFPLQYPAILGSTCAGTIEAVGVQVHNFEVGERVVTSKRFGVVGNQYGAFQRYVVVGDMMVSKVPAGVDPAIPASLMMNLTSVVGLLSGRLGLERPVLDGTAIAKGSKILVYGGSSSFGSLAVQYLSQAGYKVCTTTSPKNRSFVSQLGSTTVLDHTVTAEVLMASLKAAGPYEHVIDTISTPDTVAVTAGVLAAQGGGTLYAMQPATGPETIPAGVERAFEPWSDCLYEQAHSSLQNWVVQTYLPQGIACGAIKPVAVEKIDGGLRGVNGALTQMQRGVSGIKLVVYPWE